MRCARTVTEAFELRPSYAALQNRVLQVGYPVIGRIDSLPGDSLASRGAVRCHIDELLARYRVER
jgi:hypothetical protein